MPLQGEYAPSTSDWARNQAEEFEASGGTKNGMNGMAIVVVTSVGAKTGKLRKTPLMRVEHDGEYAVVASLGGAPNNPVWYYNLKKNPHVELQDGPVKKDYIAREVSGEERDHLVGSSRRRLSRLRQLPEEDRTDDPGLRPDRNAHRSSARNGRGLLPRP